MAMVNIRKGKATRTVNKGSYENYFRKAGWVLDTDAGGEILPFQPETTDPQPCPACGKMPEECICAEDESLETPIPPHIPPNNLTDEELLEIPVEEMTKKQAKLVADILQIDYVGEGIKSTKILKERIKAKMAEG